MLTISRKMEAKRYGRGDLFSRFGMRNGRTLGIETEILGERG